MCGIIIDDGVIFRLVLTLISYCFIFIFITFVIVYKYFIELV